MAIFIDIYRKSPWELPDGNADYSIAPAIVRCPVINLPKAYHDHDLRRTVKNLNKLVPGWRTGDTNYLLHSLN